MIITLSKLYVKTEVKKIFENKIQARRHFINVNATIYCKFKLQLKLRNNKITFL
jgi:hypothetical protein